MSGRLFDDDPITSAFAGQRRKALAAVDGMAAGALLARPLDDLVAEVMTVHRILPLVIEWDRRTVDVTVVEIELDDGGTATGTRVTYFIPCSRNTGLFHLRPASHRGEPPSGVVRPNELLLSFSGVSAEPSLVENHLATQEASVRRWAAWINEDVVSFSRDLTAEVEGRLAARIEMARAAAELPAALGVPRHEGPAGPRRDAQAARLPTSASVQHPLPSVGQRRPGRPSWTRELYAEHIAKATKATPKPHSLSAVARHFQALDGEIGVSPEWLGRLQRRFRSGDDVGEGE